MSFCLRIAWSAEDRRLPLDAGVAREATLRLPPLLPPPAELTAWRLRPMPPASPCSSFSRHFGPALLLLLLPPLPLLLGALPFIVAENAKGPLRSPPAAAAPVRLPKANSDDERFAAAGIFATPLL